MLALRTLHACTPFECRHEPDGRSCDTSRLTTASFSNCITNPLLLTKCAAWHECTHHNHDCHAHQLQRPHSLSSKLPQHTKQSSTDQHQPQPHEWHHFHQTHQPEHIRKESIRNRYHLSNVRVRWCSHIPCQTRQLCCGHTQCIRKRPGSPVPCAQLPLFSVRTA